VNFSGKLIPQARRLTAITFNMIVVTTSWAPVFTFRMAGIAAQIIPPSIAATRTVVTRIGPGRNPSSISAHAAVTIATRYCPSTPMLNIPALKQTATARAEKINGVAIARTYPIPSALPSDCSRIEE
jgi:hypothetical protein